MTTSQKRLLAIKGSSNASSSNSTRRINFLIPRSPIQNTKITFNSPTARRSSLGSLPKLKPSIFNTSSKNFAVANTSRLETELPKINVKSNTNLKLTPEKEFKPITSPRNSKMKGIWDQYQDSWFNIQSETLNPLFLDLPTPRQVKSLNDLNTHVPEKIIAENQANLSRTQYKSNSKKYKDLNNSDLETCEGCKTKKRRGIRIGCNHFVCRECLQSHIKKQIEAEKIQIKCVKNGCTYHLDKAEISKNASNTEVVKKYYDLCVSKYVERNPHQLVQCFTQGCGYVVDLTKLKHKEILNCSRCKINYCMRCHKIAHPGRQCADM